MSNGPRRHWVLPDEPRRRPPLPRSILLAGVLLVALGLLVAPLGPLLVGVAGALQLDPELAELNVPLEVVRTMSSIGVLALFGGVFQLVAGIGVLLLRRWARGLGIGVALVSAIAFGLAAVVLATTGGAAGLPAHLATRCAVRDRAAARDGGRLSDRRDRPHPGLAGRGSAEPQPWFWKSSTVWRSTFRSTTPGCTSSMNSAGTW